MKSDSKKSESGGGKPVVSKSKARKPASKRMARDPTSVPRPVASSAKEKHVRGRFSFPEADYELIAQLKLLARKNDRVVKKNELLRAGLRSLRALNEEDFIATLALFKLSKVKRSTAAQGD